MHVLTITEAVSEPISIDGIPTAVTEQNITTDEEPEIVVSLPFFDLANVPDVNELPRNLDAISEPISIDGIPIAGRIFNTAYVCETKHTHCHSLHFI